MISTRDLDQMLQSALEMKALAQKFIDFAKMNGSGEGDEGQDDLEEGEDVEEEGNDDNVSEPAPSMNKGKNAAIIIALKKKMGK